MGKFVCLLRFLLILTLVSFWGCGGNDENQSDYQGTADQSTASTLVASEELILDLTPLLKGFKENIFSEDCLFAGVDPDPARKREFPGLGVTESHWNGKKVKNEMESVRPTIAKLTGPAGQFEPDDISFSLVSGKFSDSNKNVFTTSVSFSGSNENSSVSSVNEVIWKRSGISWKINSWRVQKLSVQRSSEPFFKEVLDQALPDKESLSRARKSLHWRILNDNYFGGKKPINIPRYTDTRFYPDSINTHPSVSVVDIDGDGFDDIYVCVRWGNNLLLRNKGDGTFEESSARYGLDVSGRNTVALFADFDNDGDQDLFLGRSLEKSLYLVNKKGSFSLHKGPVSNGKLPWLVTSASAADYNNDGLLDIYICTYSPLDLNTRLQDKGNAPKWARQFLSPQQAQEVVKRKVNDHTYLNQIGPPNVLLVNRGDHFEIAPQSVTVAGYYNSFQASWADYDNDGDQDLYVANDYAPDQLFRNDDGSFSDVTSGSGINTLGFAMGASWGDYDGDGDEDLYVSNMYSKAGRRITEQIPGLDDRMSAVAYGNFLYKNDGQKGMKRMSGADEKPIPVHLAGWSWGGMFTDFDNDGFLDLYVSSGYYTPPPGQDNGVDL